MFMYDPGPWQGVININEKFDRLRDHEAHTRTSFERFKRRVVPERGERACVRS